MLYFFRPGRWRCRFTRAKRWRRTPAWRLAEAAGGVIVKQAQDVFWGGHSGYFADPDGHLWEVAWNPYVELTAAGEFRLPP